MTGLAGSWDVKYFMKLDPSRYYPTHNTAVHLTYFIEGNKIMAVIALRTSLFGFFYLCDNNQWIRQNKQFGLLETFFLLFTNPNIHKDNNQQTN